MEGVERYKVRILPHNLEWEDEFLIAEKEISKCWCENLIDIQHVGSTAVASICAKPILDIAVKLKSIRDMDIRALMELGYDYCGVQKGNENYHLFVLRGRNQVSLRHIHCYDKEDKEFDLLTGFRDYLNAHSEEAAQYEKLKRSLAEQYPDDRAAYTAGKEKFIRSIYEKMQR